MLSERPVNKFQPPTAPLENKDLSNLFSESQDLDINALEPQLLDSNLQCKQFNLQSAVAPPIITTPSHILRNDPDPYDFESFLFDQSLEGFSSHDSRNALGVQSNAYNAHEFSPLSSCGSLSPEFSSFDNSSIISQSPNLGLEQPLCEFGELSENDYMQNEPLLMAELPDEMFDLESLLGETQKQPSQSSDAQFSLPHRPLPQYNPTAVPTRVPALWESPPVQHQPMQTEHQAMEPQYQGTPAPVAQETARIQVVEGRVAKRTDAKVLERRARNTEAARKSRQKTKARISELEKIVQSLQSENEVLKVLKMTGTKN